MSKPVFKEVAKHESCCTYELALDQANKVADDNHRYIIATTEDGRFFPVFIGRDSIDLIHAGYHVAG